MALLDAAAGNETGFVKAAQMVCSQNDLACSDTPLFLEVESDVSEAVDGLWWRGVRFLAIFLVFAVCLVVFSFSTLFRVYVSEERKPLNPPGRREPAQYT